MTTGDGTADTAQRDRIPSIHVDGRHPARVAVIGAGSVGSTFAFTLVLSGLASEIVLIDTNVRRAEGEAMDLAHAVPFGPPTRVWAGSYADCRGAAITVVTAGSAQRPGESRLDLARRNDKILGEIIPAVAETNPDGLIVVGTNPVDVLTCRAVARAGLPAGRVFGSGTILDTARFRALLAERFAVDPRSVHAFVIGEHGDSEVPVWSAANIAGMALDAYCSAQGIDFDATAKEALGARVRTAAYDIIERKGATYFAVAAGLARIAEAILRDQRTVLSVSSLVEDYQGITGLCLSLPSIVGRNGVEQIVRIPLALDEAAALQHSAAVLRESLGSLGPITAPSG